MTAETAQKIVGYMENNYAQTSLPDIAEQMGLNASYLSHAFREVTGQGVHEALTVIRIRRACELLKERQQMTIADISRMVGYSNPISFSRTFRKMVGAAPTDYRANGSKKNACI